MMPNSPSETTIAAMLPLRNDGMANSENCDAGSIAAPLAVPPPRDERGERPRPTTAKAIGTGERAHGQVQSPIASGSLGEPPAVRAALDQPEDERAPTMSTRQRGAHDVDRAVALPRGTRRRVSSTPMMIRMPSGTLIPKAQRHEKRW